MIRRSVFITSCALAGVLALAGSEAGTSATSTPTTEAFAGDAQTCRGVSDVFTILANADAGQRTGRMATQEQDGWHRLATRVLGGVPTTGEGDVSDAATALKEAAPAIKLEASSATGIGSDAWETARQQLAEACTAAGSETAIEMYTGG